MKRMRKRLLSLFVVFALLATICPPRVHAEEEVEETGIFYGYITVRPIGSDQTEVFRGAHNELGEVYIHYEDFAIIAGGSISPPIQKDTYFYAIGYWGYSVDFAQAEVTAYYKTSDEQVYELYDTFYLDSCLYRENEDSEKEGEWYVHFAQMMYICHMEWLCEDFVVFPTRPETLLDIIAAYPGFSSSRVQYHHVMGDSEWEQVGNSFKYGFLVAIDEISPTFLWDSLTTSFFITNSMGYDDEVLKSALLMLGYDQPVRGSYQLSVPENDEAESFVSAASTVVDVADGTDAVERISKVFGLTVPSDELNLTIGAVSVGTNAIAYHLSVLESLWIGQRMSETFGERMQLIKAYCEVAESSQFKKQLYDVSDELYSAYNGEILRTYANQLNVSTVASLAQGAAQIVGYSSWILAGAQMSAVLIDQCVEATKLVIPKVKEALENADNKLLSLYLVKTGTVMDMAYHQCLAQLHNSRRLDEDLLYLIRGCAQVSQCASMHARTILIEQGVMENQDTLSEQEMLMRFNQSSNYDGLLLLDSGFAGLYSDQPGAVRQVIPSSYVIGLPVIDYSFASRDIQSGQEMEIKPVGESYFPREQKLYISVDTDGYHINEVTIRHETYGQLQLKPEGISSNGGNLIGVDMGNGEYTYVYAFGGYGTVAGREIVFFQPVDGALKVIKRFGIGSNEDGVRIEGHFPAGDQVKMTISPSGTEIESVLNFSYSDRTGYNFSTSEISGMFYEHKDTGYYDLCLQTPVKGPINMDTVGHVVTRYVMEDGEIQLSTQYFEPL